jgi:uncharacterized protein YyaL (SSP411 family)
MMLAALSAWYAGYSQIVIVGAGEPARALEGEVAHHYLPFALLIPISSNSARDAISARLPFTAAMTDRGGAAAYVCRDFTCRQPVTTVEALAAELLERK